MSLVTNIVIMSPDDYPNDHIDYGRDVNLAKLNAFLEKDGQPPLVPQGNESLITGTKWLECSVMVGAYNYLKVTEFIETFQGLDWSGAVLLVKKQDDEKVLVFKCEGVR